MSAAPSTAPEPRALRPRLDPLDIVLSSPGELHLDNAWKIVAGNATEVGATYDWPNLPAKVHLSCSFPPVDLCDSSLPIRLQFGEAAACGASEDIPGDTGPMIAWPGCDLSIVTPGRFPKRFAKLKLAAAAAASWASTVRTWLGAVPDLGAIARNRGAGLMEASRRGNVMRNLDISHQLDGAYE